MLNMHQENTLNSEAGKKKEQNNNKTADKVTHPPLNICAFGADKAAVHDSHTRLK